MACLGASLRLECRSAASACQAPGSARRGTLEAEARRIRHGEPARETPMISERDVAFYREQGYLVVPDVLEPETLGVLRRDLAVILEGARADLAYRRLRPRARPSRR